jgi:hypothetical protein
VELFQRGVVEGMLRDASEEAEAEAAEMRVAKEMVVEAEEEEAEAYAGMPVTMSRLCSPLVKEDMLKAVRSVICAGIDQIVLEVFDDGTGVDADGVADALSVMISVAVTVFVTTSVLVDVKVEAFAESGIDRTDEVRVLLTSVLPEGE